jgi:PAS domain-containing protein
LAHQPLPWPATHGRDEGENPDTITVLSFAGSRGNLRSMSRTRTSDEVASFLFAARTTRESSESMLAQLKTQRDAAANRLGGLRPRLLNDSDVLDELQARDEELAAVDDELRAQVVSLKHACELLERERSKYLDLFVNAPDACIVTDLNGFTQEANLRAAALFDVSPSFLAGRPLVSFVSRQDTRLFRTLLKDVEHMDGSVRSALLRMRPRGQMPFVVAARVGVVRSPSGRAVAARWSLRQLKTRDVTHAAWLIDSELARVLQDLRRPLTAIQSWVRSLRENDGADEHERAEALARIEKAAADEMGVLDDLGELGELDPDSGEKASFELLEQIRAVAAAVAPDADLQTSASRVFVSGRVDLLRKALVVLVCRAMAGQAEGAKPLQIGLSTRGDEAVVTIAADESSPTPAGWNVRLAIAARIAHSHGGRLVARDGHPSAELYLPVASPPAVAAVPAASSSSQRALDTGSADFRLSPVEFADERGRSSADAAARASITTR